MAPTVLAHLAHHGVHAPARRVGPHRVSAADRIAVALTSFDLDRRLASGEDPDSSPRLALRGRRLQRRRHRDELAKRINLALAAAEDRPWSGGSSVPLDREEVIRCRVQLLDLAELVRCGPVTVRGLAMVGQMLRDGSSPLFSLREGPPRKPGALARYLAAAAAALDDEGARPPSR